MLLASSRTLPGHKAMQTTKTKTIPSLLTLIAILFASSSAWACWDGTLISTNKVTMRVVSEEHGAVSKASFDKEELVATFLAIDKLLPDGVTLEIYTGGVEPTCTEDQAAVCDAWGELEWDETSLADLRAKVFAKFGKKPTALPKTTTTYTVQLAAGHDLEGFRKLTTKLEDAELCDRGDLATGAFPACNRSYGIVTTEKDGETFYRLYFAEHFTREGAEETRAELEELGLKGFVRPIEQRFIL